MKLTSKMPSSISRKTFFSLQVRGSLSSRPRTPTVDVSVLVEMPRDLEGRPPEPLHEESFSGVGQGNVNLALAACADREACELPEDLPAPVDTVEDRVADDLHGVQSFLSLKTSVMCSLTAFLS